MEANNMAAMREALEMMSSLFANGVICTSYANTQEEMEQIEELYRKAKAALSAPPRNCDVGTAGEQYRRWTYFCKCRIESGTTCLGCPVFVEQNKGQNSTCELVWAQMPYEAEGAGK